MEKFETAYTPELDDHVTFMLYYWSNDAATKRRMWVRDVLFALIWTVIFTQWFVVDRSVYLFETAKPSDTVAAFKIAAFFCVTVCVSRLFTKAHWKRYAKRRIMKNDAPFFGKETRLSFADDKMTTEDSVGTATLDVSAIVKVDEIADYVFFFVSPARAIVVPKRRIANADELDAWLPGFVAALDVPYTKNLAWKW